MATVAETPSTASTITTHVAINDELLEAVTSSVNRAMEMCDKQVRCVGVSRIPARGTGNITGLIGVHGKVSGFITINMAEQFAIKAVGGLLGEEHDRLSSQIIDGAGEITNIVVGGIKSHLSKTKWNFPHITVPSVIVGHDFSIAYCKGLEFLNVTFESDDPEAIHLEDRMMHISMSLLAL